MNEAAKHGTVKVGILKTAPTVRFGINTLGNSGAKGVSFTRLPIPTTFVAA